MQKQQNKNIAALLTAFVIFFSVIALGIVYAPMLFGLKAYAVETGSMEPTIPEGSMVYVQKYSSFEDYQVNDVVTFTDPSTSESFTHRIVQIDSAQMMFVTQGDANSIPDLEPTQASLAVGKVKFSIPFLGYAASLLKSNPVKIAVVIIYIAWAAIEIEIYLTERKKKYD